MSLVIMREVALSYLGTPYVWGGSGYGGVDCSGAVQEILASVGEDPPGDQTAQSLYDFFLSRSRWNEYSEGALAFFGRNDRMVTHVGYMLDPYNMLEAGGGDSTALTREDAIKRNAFVRVRPLLIRRDLVAVLRPNYLFEFRGRT